ncbi:F-box protein At4g00755 isoform X2 [Herrania umbratica]|uniref:F-box protein At4g00755 isoform X2 n=1 Tax=Herrania umbratica TaxID=108875 RepID=A0A6J0ZZ81_9ROSI|nr:F-box protein At4g00755 isoform X2 [Herrania umbratica]
MQGGVDFLNCLHHDLSIKILMSLEDPADLVRLGVVSRSWRHFVITNGLCKNLCRRMFPQLSRLDRVNELSGIVKRHAEAGPSKFMEWEALEREHRVFAFLARGCLSFGLRDCISEAIIASSTDNYPEERIDNTLEPRDRVARRASYWSSKGQSNPEVPEMLTYKLAADLCVITDINIRPFQAYFQLGYPIYSAKSVRFRMGHIKSSMDCLVDDSWQGSSDDKYAWTYTSREFPMSQGLVMTSMHGLTPHRSFQCLRKIACRISGFQNLFFALVESYRLSCWVGSRDRRWMVCSIYACLMFKFWDARWHLVSVFRYLNPLKNLC